MRVLAFALLACAAVVATAIGVSPAPAQPRQAGAPTSFEELRVERMLENRIACLGCHVIEGSGGRIGPPLDGLAERADADYVRNVISDPSGTVPGTTMPMQRVPGGDLERLTAYLMTRPATPVTGPDVTPTAPPALSDSEQDDGAALYARHCTACHGEQGAGDGWNAATLPVQPTPHSDAALMGERTDDSLFDAIHSGAFVLDGSPRMPPYGALLSTTQIRALVSHIRTLCDCEQPAWAGG